MPQYVFGVGDLSVVGADGNTLKIGTLQEVSIEFSKDLKHLRGNKGYALTTAEAGKEIKGKIGMAELDVDLYNTLFFNEASVATGAKIPVKNELGTIPTTPFTITPANVTGGKTFDMDQGVVFADTGVALTRVATAPTTGQYSLNTSTGVYTFAAADTGKKVLISYIYADTAVGKTLTITNKDMDVAPTFILTATSKYDGKTVVIKLFAVVASGLSMPFKLDDFSIRDIPFEARDPGSGVIGYISRNP